MICDCLIVGAGHAGVQAAFSLRQMHFDGSIGLLSEEAEPPYERPPLSKDFLSGYRDAESLLLRRADAWAEHGIDLMLDHRVTAVHPGAHEVELAGGMRLSYRTLIWAAGGKPRRLSCPGGELAGVHAIRTRTDAAALRDELSAAERVAIVGGGYIGLETAAVFAAMGKAVTVIEAQDRVMARVAGEPVSRFYQSEHQSRGVVIRLGTAVRSLDGAAGRVTAIQLADGSEVAADIAIAAIGMDAADGPLLRAGAEGDRGIEVDGFCRTTLPDIFAIGDCVLQANPCAQGRMVRVESVQNAADQAINVAKTLTGGAEPYRSLPWFWSNQYDLRLQTLGISGGHDDCLIRGEPQSRRFTAVYLHGDTVSALDCVNSTKDFVQGRGLIGKAVPRSARDAITDSAVPLRDVISACTAWRQ